MTITSSPLRFLKQRISRIESPADYVKRKAPDITTAVNTVEEGKPIQFNSKGQVRTSPEKQGRLRALMRHLHKPTSDAARITKFADVGSKAFCNSSLRLAAHELAVYLLRAPRTSVNGETSFLSTPELRRRVNAVNVARAQAETTDGKSQPPSIAPVQTLPSDDEVQQPDPDDIENSILFHGINAAVQEATRTEVDRHIAITLQRTADKLFLERTKPGNTVPRFAPSLLNELNDPPTTESDQRFSELDKLDYYLKQTNLLELVGVGDRFNLNEYRKELAAARDKQQSATNANPGVAN